MPKGQLSPLFQQGQSQGIPQHFPVQSMQQFQQSPLGQYAASLMGGQGGVPGPGGFGQGLTPINTQAPQMPAALPQLPTTPIALPPPVPGNPGGGLPMRGPGGGIPEPGLGGNGIMFPDPLGGVG